MEQKTLKQKLIEELRIAEVIARARQENLQNDM